MNPSRAGEVDGEDEVEESAEVWNCTGGEKTTCAVL